jgi:hypothetical protein
MGHHARGDWGYKVGLEASAAGFSAASLLTAGHAHAMERVRADREAREQGAYDAARLPPALLDRHQIAA